MIEQLLEYTYLHVEERIHMARTCSDSLILTIRDVHVRGNPIDIYFWCHLFAPKRCILGNGHLYTIQKPVVMSKMTIAFVVSSQSFQTLFQPYSLIT